MLHDLHAYNITITSTGVMGAPVIAARVRAYSNSGQERVTVQSIEVCTRMFTNQEINTCTCPNTLDRYATCQTERHAATNVQQYQDQPQAV